VAASTRERDARWDWRWLKATVAVGLWPAGVGVLIESPSYPNPEKALAPCPTRARKRWKGRGVEERSWWRLVMANDEG